jgi:hypothetical protein
MYSKYESSGLIKASIQLSDKQQFYLISKCKTSRIVARQKCRVKPLNGIKGWKVR